jgi:hypothetical protein
MKNLSQLFATELSKKTEITSSFDKMNEGNVLAKRSSLRSARVVQSPQSILQLNSVPLKIDINKFKNPHSPDNPTGDYKAAYRLSVLANTISTLTPFFNNSFNLVSDIWGNIINSAESDAPYTKKVINKAKEKFTLAAMASMAGFPDNWYPVYTNPFNWYDVIMDDSNLIKMELDINSGETDNNNFIVLDKNTPVIWKVNNQENELNLKPKKTIKKIYLSLLRVDIIRSWFEFELLNLQNWKIDGLKQGYYSNGNLDLNSGIFPLITQSMLIGTQISVEGDFSENDIREIKDCTDAGKDISVGSFLLNTNGQNAVFNSKEGNTTMTSNIMQIVGYLSRLVPMAPSLPED